MINILRALQKLPPPSCPLWSVNRRLPGLDENCPGLSISTLCAFLGRSKADGDVQLSSCPGQMDSQVTGRAGEGRCQQAEHVISTCWVWGMPH